MNDLELNIIDLEQQITAVEIDAVKEEQKSANDNYKSLNNELKYIIAEIPYPETKPYTIASDYDEISRIQFEKSCNKPYWKKQEQLEFYCNEGSLYIGHLKFTYNNYFIMDSIGLDTKIIRVNGNDVFLINSDDKKYSEIVKRWRYPNENKGVVYSRNITMRNRRVIDVDIVLDNENDVYKEITDGYLRKALVRNKSKTDIQSIIQTIQKKQDYIRSYPINKSFIVQGCAGSGKTMVLLHRIRYLVYNKEMNSDQYLLLVPGNNFKGFISGASAKFNINKDNTYTFQEYYKYLLGKKSKETDKNDSESVFSSEYLLRVYSKEFLQECYSELFSLLLEQINDLIDFSDNKLNEAIEYETLIKEEEIQIVKNSALKKVDNITTKIQGCVSVKIDNNYDNIQEFITEVTATYEKKKSIYETVTEPNYEVNILPNDERIISNKRLQKISKDIEEETAAFKKASMFTVNAHKKKLARLNELYNQVYSDIVDKLIEEEKKKYLQQKVNLGYVYEGVTLAEIEEILLEANELLTSTKSQIEYIRRDLNNINEYFAKKYNSIIQGLNILIELSSEIETESKDFVDKLVSCDCFFTKNTKVGISLLQNVKPLISDKKEKEKVDEKFRLFNSRTDKQLQAYLNTLLFNICKRKIKEEFDIKICDVYKHYWYLMLYCQYLTRDNDFESHKYIFIDEAQDLSVSEIELINRINRRVEKWEIGIVDEPVLNLFGDVNQVITEHGISDWKMVKEVPNVIFLEENFRNTNQVVDYSNNNLPFKMTKIGVDMDKVDEYESVDDLIERSMSINNNVIFIVKDDYSREDLKITLNRKNIYEYKIYTVKEVKGLEFKEVYVCETDMTANEKYISYTRALVKLNVIKDLPQLVDRKTKLIVQGDEQTGEPSMNIG